MENSCRDHPEDRKLNYSSGVGVRLDRVNLLGLEAEQVSRIGAYAGGSGAVRVRPRQPSNAESHPPRQQIPGSAGGARSSPVCPPGLKISDAPSDSRESICSMWSRARQLMGFRTCEPLQATTPMASFLPRSPTTA